MVDYRTKALGFILAIGFMGSFGNSYAMPPYVEERHRPSEDDLLTASRIESLKETLSKQHDIWHRNGDWGYSYLITQYCYCGTGLESGPNRVTFEFPNSKTVIYEGKYPTNKESYIGPADYTLDDGISEVFYRVTEKIGLGESLLHSDDHGFLRGRRPQPLLRVEFHPEFGFPTLISWDEPDSADDEWVLTVTEFKLAD